MESLEYAMGWWSGHEAVPSVYVLFDGKRDSRNIKKCQFCGAEFEKGYYLSRRVWDDRRFCSRKCSGLAKRGGTYAVKTKTKARNYCELCGREIFGLPNKRFCSIKCHAEWRKQAAIPYKPAEVVEYLNKYQTAWQAAEAMGVNVETLRKYMAANKICSIYGILKG